MIGEEDDKFDLLLVGDHDFDLFKQVRFNPHHEIWITPETLNNTIQIEISYIAFLLQWIYWFIFNTFSFHPIQIIFIYMPETL